MVTVPVSDGNLGAVFFCELADFICFTRSANVGLLDVDSAHARHNGVRKHLMVLVGVARADGDDVGTRFFQERPMIGMGFRGGETLLRCGAPIRVGVGYSDDGGPWLLEPQGVEPVTVVAASGVTNDADAERCPLGDEVGKEWCGGYGGEKGASEHGIRGAQRVRDNREGAEGRGVGNGQSGTM